MRSTSKTLREGAKQHLGGLLEISNVRAGLYTIGYLKNGMTSRRAEELAATQASGYKTSSLNECHGAEIAVHAKPLGRLVRVKCGANFLNVGSVGADSVVELIAGNAELFGPVGNVGSHLWVNLFGVVRAFGVVFVEGVGLVLFGSAVVLGHRMLPLFCSLS